jgi:hypothetical protein
MRIRPSSISFHRLMLVILLWGTSFGLGSAHAAGAPTFVLRNPTPRGTSLQSVAFANNRFVAVGNTGLVLTSTDAATWHVAATLQGDLNAVAFGGGQWIAVGGGGRIFTSPDAFNWTARSSPTTQALVAVTFASSQYLACGAAGTLLTSPDGISWTARASGTTQLLNGIAGRTGAHVAVGDSNTLLRSSDGATWTPHVLTEPVADLRCAAILNNQFVIVGNSGRVYTSPDGVTWTSRASSGPGGATYENVIYDGTQYIITTFGGDIVPTANFTNRPLLLTSFNPKVPRFGIAFGAGVTVVVGLGGDIATSTDGRTWTQRGSSGAEYRINSIASLNGRWFGGATYGPIFSSADGVTWNRLVGTASNELLGWAYGANRYVGVGTGGFVTTSADGVTWSGNTTSSGVTRNLTSATFGNGRFVAVGDGGVVTTSTDGLTWTPRTSGVTSNLNTAITLGNRHIVVGDAGVILTSTDGVSWTRASYNGGRNLGVACVYAGLAYAAGSNGTIISSPDGQTWTQRKNDNFIYAGIAPAHGGLIAAVASGIGFFSPDGIRWDELPLPVAGERIFGAASDGTTAMIAGTGGTILQSVDPSAPPSRIINVATRGLVQPGGALTPGFVLRGTGSKQVVVRAIGPTLSAFGLNGLADVKLDVVNQQTNAVAATNDDWGGSAALVTRFASLGAFALGATSKDAAVQASLPVNSGGYSVRITAAGTASTGVALAEVYDGDADDSPVRVINVSTLGFVGTNENVLTPGFVIRGAAPKRLLIRAIGPGLAPLGVTGLLTDPQFSVFASSSTVALASSNDWGGTVELKAAFTAAGAFSIPDTSRDAAVVVTLPAGAYTVVASGVGNTTGTAIVEVYDLDP